jgi:regulator of replication initiation timing
MNALEADMRERIISLVEENKRLKTEIKHKNQLWKTAFKKYKNLKKIIAALVGLDSSKPKVN